MEKKHRKNRCFYSFTIITKIEMKKINFIFWICMSWSVGFTFAQKTFLNTIGSTEEEQGYGIVQTTDGNFVSAGFTSGLSSVGTMSYCTKYSNNGDILWTKTIGYLVQEKAYAIAPTNDGGVIIGGEGKYCVNFNCGTDAFIIKLDAYGEAQWTRGFGGIAWDDIQDIHQLPDGGYILAGNTVSYGQGSYDMFMIRTNANGDTLWTKTYGTTGVVYAEEKTANVIATEDGGFLLCGNLYKGDDNTSNNYLACLIKTNGNGEVQWANNYYGVGMTVDKGVKALQLSNGNYLLATYSGLMTISPSGSILSNKKIPSGFTFIGGQWGWGSIAEGIDGDIIACGGHAGDACIFKFDLNWNIIWAKKIGTGGGSSYDFFHEVTQITDGRILVSGYTSSMGVGGGKSDNLTVVMDSYGNIASGCGADITITLDNLSVTSEPRTVLIKSGFLTSSPTSTATDVSSTAVSTQICSESYTVGISDILHEHVKIYPNPSQGDLMIQSDIPLHQLMLFDMYGKTFIYPLSSQNVLLFPELVSGTYLYQIQTDRGLITGKWIKK